MNKIKTKGRVTMLNLKEIKNYITVFLLIFVSVTPLLSTSSIVLILFFLCLLNLKYLKSIKLNKKTLVLMIFIFLFVLTGIIDIRNITYESYSVLNIYFPLCFVLGYMISLRFKLNEYLYYMERITYIGAIFSIVGMFILSVSPSIIANLPDYTYGGFTHKTGILFNVLVAEGNFVFRNTGFAREPGVFQLLLNIGVLQTVNSNDEKRVFKLVIYGLAIFLTRSTVGLIIYGILLMKMLKEVPQTRFLFAAVILFFLNDIYQELSYQVEYKLIGSRSFEGRFEKSINAFSLGSDYLFGVGNTGYNNYYLVRAIGAWDSYGQIFLRYGYLMLIIYILVLIKLAQKNMGLFIIIALTNLSQGVWFNVFLTPIYFMAFDKSN